jgi:hypothetical protein
LAGSIEAFKTTVHKTTAKAMDDMKESERLAELRSNDVADRCRKKAMKNDEELLVLKEQYDML